MINFMIKEGIQYGVIADIFERLCIIEGEETSDNKDLYAFSDNAVSGNRISCGKGIFVAQNSILCSTQSTLCYIFFVCKIR